MASKLSRFFQPCTRKLNRKKLIVLNLGGLLYDRYHRSQWFESGIPMNRPPDFNYGSSLVYKRPYCEEFMEYCFKKFDVGVWSSAQSQNIEDILEHVIGDAKSKLQFVWYQDQCTKFGKKCWDCEGKPILLKNLRKLQAELNLSTHFSLSNTLLVDNDPYRALLNPPNTAIFPVPYDASNVDDIFLGPKGEMQAFLNGLANAADVPTYVKEHPFGQPALTPLHPDWGRYSQIIQSLRKQEDGLEKI